MREYRELLADYPGRLISLDDAGIPDEVEETGNTFLANAHLKAATYATLSGQLTVSDDSGLEVHALGGDARRVLRPLRRRRLPLRRRPS